MTEPTAPGAAPNETAGLQIHKVLSRGAGAEAQMLLVLLSAPVPLPDDEDIWVGIGITEPVPIFTRESDGYVESGRPITYDELKRLAFDRREEDDPPFGLADAPGRGYRLARFEFSDHPLARDRWNRALQGQDQASAPALDVTCWRTRPGPVADSKGVLHDGFVPSSGPEHEAVSFGDVVTQPLFELGVLFVHGIGSQGERETLVHWSEPIVNFWRSRAFAISKAAGTEIAGSLRIGIGQWVESHALRNRTPISGISETVGNFARENQDSSDLAVTPPRTRPEDKEPTLCCMTAKPEQTLFPDRNPGAPSATLLRLSTLDSNASLRESHVLFAESAWAKEAFPPTPDELYAWLTRSIPIAVWARVQRLATTRRLEIAQFDVLAKTRFEKFRVAVSRVLLLLQQLVLPTAYVILALSSQVAIALVGLIGLLPIPWLGRGIRWVVSALMGTLGQSYALQTSPIRRSAIVSSVALDIDWLSDRCQHIVILSHSQGAEISRLASLEARRDKMLRWYTAGSGIAPLNMLSPKSLDTRASHAVIRVSEVLLATALALVVLVALDSIPGVDWGIRGFLAGLVRGVRPEYVATAYAALSMVLILLCDPGPAVSPSLRLSLMKMWTDIYASEDPVPGGSLQDRWRKDIVAQKITGLKQWRIFNARFTLSDHTAYFSNIEQFIAPIALDLLRHAGMGSVEESEAPALKAAADRRDLRTWWNIVASTLASSAAAISFVWIAFGPPGRATAWFAEGVLAWKDGNDAWGRLSLAWSNGLAGMVINDLGLPLLLVALMVLGWSVCRYLAARSEKVLIHDLARAARKPGTRAARPPNAAASAATPASETGS
jgi:hypothetical protein